MAEGNRVSFGGDGKVLKLTVELVVRTCDSLKTTERYSLQW